MIFLVNGQTFNNWFDVQFEVGDSDFDDKYPEAPSADLFPILHEDGNEVVTIEAEMSDEEHERHMLLGGHAVG